MISRQTREAAGGVLSFTFLDVLTCTMGSLVLLVVILGEKAADVRLDDALRNGPRRLTEDSITGVTTAEAAAETAHKWTIDAEAEEPSFPVSAEEASAALAEIREQKAKLESLQVEGQERVKQEQTRVSQLEDHERRLEHELAQLHITLQRLQDAEKEQTVDQQTAERELERLRRLLKDAEEQLKALRTMDGGKKSFAIIPYKGSNGTFRRPIYIECTATAVVIRPEGIVLTPMDFDGPIRSGSPLAAAVRAAGEELNSRAVGAGSDRLPDPYPLLIVRPDGVGSYKAALDAIRSFNSDFGYEFIEADWNLAFPEPDPKLSQVMTHAVEQARSRQATLARIAPRSYATRLPNEGHAPRNDDGVHYGSGPSAGDAGFDALASAPGSGNMIGQQAGKGWLSSSLDGARKGSSNRPRRRAHGHGGAQAGELTGDGSGSSAGTFAEQVVAASTPDESGANAATSRGADAATMSDGQLADASAIASAMAPGQGLASVASGPPTMAGGASSSAAPAAQSTHNAAMSGGPLATGSQLGGGQSIRANDRTETASAAETRGANWANDAAKHQATPITRPVHVVVQPDQLNVLTDANGPAAEAAVISFHQPTDEVLDELALHLRQRVKEWGLAGQGMYWRPTLVLQVSPGADQHAARLNNLLKDSGVDIRLEEVAARSQQEQPHGPR